MMKYSLGLFVFMFTLVANADTVRKGGDFASALGFLRSVQCAKIDDGALRKHRLNLNSDCEEAFKSDAAKLEACQNVVQKAQKANCPKFKAIADEITAFYK